uniref:Uncharacterized protein n=1 Tax=Picea glauca TaxID=3330 RepID=A0A101M5T7_PICGL|nr:hypothetical protein ABT39_MTgene1246 [Picea glauca]
MLLLLRVGLVGIGRRASNLGYDSHYRVASESHIQSAYESRPTALDLRPSGGMSLASYTMH